MLLYYFGLYVHFILLIAVSDIFFHNYTARNERKCEDRIGVAKRVVFIVASGLDESQLNQYSFGHTARALCCRGIHGSIVETPFNSKLSGNIALVSGYNIDPITSYVTRLLNESVEVDNVMNKSNLTVYIGDKDVFDYTYKNSTSNWLSYFIPNGKSVNCKTNYSYLGNYAAGQIESLFDDAVYEEHIKEKLGQDKIIYYINLAFVADSVQVSNRESNLTKSAVTAVFSTVEAIVKYVNLYYLHDGRTTFVLCSNFVEDDSKIKPFLTWGAGIPHSSLSYTLKQVDFPDLISVLLGLQIATNSRGMIPFSVVDITYDASIRANKCKITQLNNIINELERRLSFGCTNLPNCSSNIDQLLQKFIETKKNFKFHKSVDTLTKLTINKLKQYESFFKDIIWYCSVITSFFWMLLIFSVILPYKESIDNKAFVSFSAIKLKMSGSLNSMNSRIRTLREKIHLKKCNDGSSKCNKVEEGTSLESDIVIKTGATTKGKLNIVDRNNEKYTQNENDDKKKLLISWNWLRVVTDLMFFIIVSVLFMTLFFMDAQPMMLIYCSTPVLLLWLISYTLIDWLIFAKEYLRNIWKALLFYGIVFIFVSWLVIEALDKESFGLELGIVLIFQSVFYIKKSLFLVCIWFLSGGCMILLDSINLWIQHEVYNWAQISCSTAFILWSSYATFQLSPVGEDLLVSVSLICQQVISLTITILIDFKYLSDDCLVYVNVLSWFLLAAVFIPMVHKKSEDISYTILNICMALGIPLIMFSTSYEVLYYTLMANFMLSWLLLEGSSENWLSTRQLQGEDARRALLVTFFIIFTTMTLGNTYGFLSSNISTVRCFISSFSEPIFWFIQILKPFFIYVMIIAIFLLVSSSNGVTISQSFNLVLLIFQFIGIRLFFLIRQNDDGTITVESLKAVKAYFSINILTILIILAVLFCRCIYRLPLAKSVSI